VNALLSLLVLGLASAALYAVAASGLVVTYTTSGIFNFAHGAVAMISAFVYWQLSSPVAWDLPVPLALVLTLFVFAPAFGFLVDRVLMRRLHDATPITRIVVPIGLLVALIQVATIIWPPSTVNASLPRFFAGHSVTLAGVVVEYHYLVVFATAIVVAIGLRLLLYRSRVGVAMRAVVDSRDLAALNGVSPDRISGLAWALGCTLAAVAGVLIAPLLGNLDQAQLTLLVINAYAAAMVGRLRSLPLTALGALILGIAREAASRYSDSLPSWINVDTVPALMLFVVLVVVPQDKADLFGSRKDRSEVPSPSWSKVMVAGLVMVAAAIAVPSFFSVTTTQAIGYGVALGIVALSLVPLSGYAGQISLAPLAFAGIGAVVMYKVGANGNPLALVAVVLVCAVVGAVVALPTLRLKGLYLALATFAFALLCEKALFPNVAKFADGSAAYGRLGIGSVRATSDRADLVLMAVIFVGLGVLVTALRRGRFGRRLQAMKDSPAACATLGLNTNLLKLEVFALSSAIAGLGGALLGSWRGKVGTEQFSLLQGALPGLPLVLLAVVGGIAAVAGVLLGALLLSVFPVIAAEVPSLADLMTILPGLAGVSLASNPNGAIAQTVAQLRVRRERRQATADGVAEPLSTGGRLLHALLPTASSFVPERIGVGGATSEADIDRLDDELGLSWGRCRVDPRDT
jgi:branched-chain amino acid transport system permease protein